jgi:hypothetical protein
MATFWDVGTIEYVTPVLIFILVFVLIYAILQKTKMLGGVSKVDFIVAMVLGLIALVSENTVKFISVISGWYVLLFVAIILITMVLAFGAKSGADLTEAIPKLPLLMSIAFYVSLVILLASIAHVFGPVFQPYSADADPSWWALRVVFNPKVVGTVLIMLIALLVISKLTKES